MDREKEVYLDSAGAPRPSSKLLRAVFEDLEGNALGNPHSGGSADALLTEARALVLKHFGASSEEYDCVFTSGSTAGLKMVGELFPFGEHGHLIHSTSVHTSLLGIRGYSGRSVNFASKLLYEDRVGRSFHDSRGLLPVEEAASQSNGEYHLFATSGECNFSGAKINLQGTSKLYRKWKDPANGRDIYDELVLEDGSNIAGKEGQQGECKDAVGRTKYVKELPWMWLLDAAKLASTSPICLAALPQGGRPDFVTVSFYKMFGYPTGLGALLVRKEMSALLRARKKYFGGGTVHAVAATSHFLVPREQPNEYMEDGTVHFQGISALRHCFHELEQEGGMRAVATKTGALCASLEQGLRSLQHSSGVPLVELYRHRYPDSKQDGVSLDIEEYTRQQGPVLALNLRWADGSPVGHNTVRRLASQPETGPPIALRVGCFCNIGGCQEALSLTHTDIERNYSAGRYCWSDEVDIVNGARSGAVRVSLGRQSTGRDVAAFLAFLKAHFLDRMGVEGREQEQEQEQTMRDLQAVAREAPCPPAAAANPSLPFPPTAPASPSSRASASGSNTNAVLAGMYVYPIKSAGGIRVPRWLLHRHSGLLLDREWVVCDTRSGRAITLKTSPQLCMLRTRVLRVPPSPGSAADQVVVLVEAPASGLAGAHGAFSHGGGGCQAGKAQARGPLVLPVSDGVARALLQADCVQDWLPAEYTHGLQREGGDDGANAGAAAGAAAGSTVSPAQQQEQVLSVKICAERRRALATAEDADSWFSAYLELPCRLLRGTDGGGGEDAGTNSVVATGATGQRQSRSFANEAPLLVVNGPSVRELREVMNAAAPPSSAYADTNAGAAAATGAAAAGEGGHTVDVLNFRPNLVVEGRPSLEEAKWTGLHLTSPASSSSSSSSPSSSSSWLSLRVDKPCPRCSVINVNPSTGVMEGRALSSLACFNPVRGGASNCFGVFVSAAPSDGDEGWGAGELRMVEEGGGAMVTCGLGLGSGSGPLLEAPDTRV